MKIFGFYNSTNPFPRGGLAIAYAIAEDGRCICSHASSNESWAKHDLGMDGSSNWKHEYYREAFPDGYELEFVHIHEFPTHEGLKRAMELNEKLGKEAEENEAGDAD